MSWAETKYAINSSVGTDDFKPIDKMLEYEIFPSDIVALDLGSLRITNAEENKKIKLGIGGKCRVSFTMSGDSTFYGFVRVLLNGNEIYSIRDTSIGNKTFATDITSVNKNDLITIEYQTRVTGGTYYIDDLCILGSVLPNGTFKEVI